MTESWNRNEHDLRGERYLAGMEDLESELGRALRAIAGNALSALEESIWKQESLCANLGLLAVSLDADSMHIGLVEKIRSTGRALQDLNRCYATLVEQSSRSAELLSMLYRCYSGHPTPTMNSHEGRQSWSCEV